MNKKKRREEKEDPSSAQKLGFLASGICSAALSFINTRAVPKPPAAQIFFNMPILHGFERDPGDDRPVLPTQRLNSEAAPRPPIALKTA
ncbi:hypothetical protein [Geomonas subterranea]|uniref:hypothetical protein n=1 Tax=Geomonas subterranea TaxID=2847989 RepID=UPI001CD1E0CC|nr:hypothetical protein [Geomonas fuzhouensis]